MSENEQVKIDSDSTKGSGILQSVPDPKPRVCIGPCGKPLSSQRLSAQPNARMCVPCLVVAGDVAPIKRFDEQLRDGEVQSTYFTHDRRIERQINHLNKSTDATDADYYAAVGDDSHRTGAQRNSRLRQKPVVRNRGG